MGGADTEVTAIDHAPCCSRAPASTLARSGAPSRALGLSTEAAYRFERGIDIEGVVAALDRAAQLMADLGGGHGGPRRHRRVPGPAPAPRLALRPERVERLIGAAPPGRRPCRILRALGFAVDDVGRRAPGGGAELPTRRRPGGRPRRGDRAHLGLRQDPLTLAPAGEITPVRRPACSALARAIGARPHAAGLAESITYAFVDPDRLKAMGWRDPARLVVAPEPAVARALGDAALARARAPGGARDQCPSPGPDVRVFEIGDDLRAASRRRTATGPRTRSSGSGLALTGLRAPARVACAPRARGRVRRQGHGRACPRRRGRARRGDAPFAAGEEPRLSRSQAAPPVSCWTGGGRLRSVRWRTVRGRPSTYPRLSSSPRSRSPRSPPGPR